MFSQSIRRKIVGIALGLVVLMIATSVLSTLMANRVGHLLDELTNKYLPAYGDLARAHVRAAAAQAVEAREIDRLVVAGQTRPQIVFEIMGRAGELSAEQIALRAHYSEGLAAYRARHWDEATSALKAALAAAPGDGPCMVLLTRVESLRDNPPPADWDGSWRLDQKNPATQPTEVGRP